MEKYDVIIIGAGASGIMCASNIYSKKVLLLEKQDKIGKKILVTGNGRCNLTNKNLLTDCYNTDLVSKFFDKFNNYDLLNYFSSIGLSYYFDDEGRCYPTSNYASSVLDIMRLNLNKHKNVTILTNSPAKNIDFKNGKYFVSTDNETYPADNVVFSTGGDFENIFNFKIDFVPFYPSLCGFKTEKNKGLNGVKQKNVKATLSNSQNFCEQGELLFKENGVSGICIFNLSNHYDKNGKNTLKIDLLPNISTSDLFDDLKHRCTIFDSAENLLTSLFQKQLIASILEKSNIKSTTPTCDLKNTDLQKITDTIKNYTIKITGLENNNQIFSGGVKLENLSDNLEYQKGLYFVGESCNVSGKCGGYNLQWAFTSGKIVGDLIDKV